MKEFNEKNPNFIDKIRKEHMEYEALDKDADPNFNNLFYHAMDNAKIHALSEQILRYFLNNMKELNSHDYKVQKNESKDADFKITKMVENIQSRKSNTTLWNKDKSECLRKFEIYKEERYLDRTWFHISMDMFYAECELRTKSHLFDKPVAVGEYNIIKTNNSIARKWGVLSGMPRFMGINLCPKLVCLGFNSGKYKRISEEELIPILK